MHADFIGFVASVLCIIHCLTFPFLISLMPLFGAAYLENPMIEMGFILFSLIVTAYALRNNFKGNRKRQLPLWMAAVGFIIIFAAGLTVTEAGEIIVKSIGVALVTSSHFVNWRILHSN